MSDRRALVPVEDIARSIHTMRGLRVMLDSDLALLYGVTTSRLNEQVKRNQRRFPSDFMFRLTREEVTSLISQSATSKRGRGGRQKLPKAYTEHGAVMVAMVLNSARAVDMSVFVVRAFLRLREWVTGQADLASRLAELERRVGAHDHELKAIIQTIRGMLQPPAPPGKQIGFRQS